MLRAVTIAAGLLLLHSVCWLGFGTADAALIPPTLPVVEIAPPPSVVQGALESDTLIRVFLERSNLTLASPLAVNVTLPDTYAGTLAGFNPLDFILAGTVIESYFFHMDLDGPAGANTSYEGSATFTTDILGIIWSESKLNDTDLPLGLATVVYPGGGVKRGSLDSPGSIDTITLSATLRTVSFKLGHDDGNIEQFRVITLIPEPSSLALAVFGFAALIAWGWRCRKRRTS